MPLFRSQQDGTQGALLHNLSKGVDAGRLMSALPEMTDHLTSLAQKSAIRLYRKIHSHETGSFLMVRDEFLFLICQVFRQKVESSLPPDDAAMVWRAFQEALRSTLARLQRDFDHAAFRQTEARRAERYSGCSLVKQDGEISLSGTSVISLFAEHQTLHLGQELAPKIRHFSEHVLRELQNQL